uniref:PilZ domain-containing protein n=1 Tax=Coralloluteibacterium stylophorae TaxID=1776034 RepID=A0A8J7VWK2_9GAMM
MTPSEAERRLFDEAVACDDRLAFDFTLLPLDARAAGRACDRTEHLLRGLAAAEDARREDPDDSIPEPALARLEAKLDLLIGLVGALAARDAGLPPAVELRWERHGLRVQAEFGGEPGATGLVRIQAAHWLPQLLELPARILARGTHADGAAVWLQIEAGAALDTALERHLFRLHRRAVAEARRQAAGG